MNRSIFIIALTAIPFSSQGQQIMDAWVKPSAPLCGDSVSVILQTWRCTNQRLDSIGSRVTMDSIFTYYYLTAGPCLGLPFVYFDTVFTGIAGGNIGSGNFTVLSLMYDTTTIISLDTQTVVIGSCCGAQAAFTPSSSLVCPGSTVNFTNQSTGGISYKWKVDGVVFATTFNASRTFSTKGLYSIELFTTNGACGDSVSMFIEVVTAPAAVPFTWSSTDRTLQFTEASTGNAYASYQWDFGDLTTDTARHPSHTFPDTGNYLVCLVISNFCGADSICAEVDVQCTFPVSSFTWSLDSLTITLTETSTGATSWYWSFGDGAFTAVRNPVYTYGSPGIYTLCLVATNDCGDDTLCQDIAVGNVGVSERYLPERLILYPHPVTGESWIDFSESPGSVKSVTLTDIPGREISVSGHLAFRGGKLVFIKGDLPAGTYFVSISAKKQYIGIIQLN